MQLELDHAAERRVVVMADHDRRLEDVAGRAVPVTEATLDAQRGGFDTPELHIGMQLQRAVYVNGEEVVRLSADIPDGAHMTAAQAETPPRGLGP